MHWMMRRSTTKPMREKSRGTTTLPIEVSSSGLSGLSEESVGEGLAISGMEWSDLTDESRGNLDVDVVWRLAEESLVGASAWSKSYDSSSILIAEGLTSSQRFSYMTLTRLRCDEVQLWVSCSVM